MVAFGRPIHRIPRCKGGMMPNRIPICSILLALAAMPAVVHCDEKAPAKMEPFAERVKGTLVRFEMLPINGGKFVFSPDGKEAPKEVEIKSFYMARTETTWDQYETWYLQ